MYFIFINIGELINDNIFYQFNDKNREMLWFCSAGFSVQP